MENTAHYQALGLNFRTMASAGWTLQAEAERFSSEISQASEGSWVLASTLLNAAWKDASSSAKQDGRRVKRGEVLAHLYDYKDRCKHGLTL